MFAGAKFEKSRRKKRASPRDKVRCSLLETSKEAGEPSAEWLWLSRRESREAREATRLEGTNMWNEKMSVNTVGYNWETTVFIHVPVGISSLHHLREIREHFWTFSTIARVSSLGKYKSNFKFLFWLKLPFCQLRSDSSLWLGHRSRTCRLFLLLSSKYRLPTLHHSLSPQCGGGGLNRKSRNLFTQMLLFVLLSNVESPPYVIFACYLNIPPTPFKEL